MRSKKELLRISFIITNYAKGVTLHSTRFAGSFALTQEGIEDAENTFLDGLKEVACQDTNITKKKELIVK